jgi:diguanylate cyclase (GGDEF)-like protein/PAS domain S-box-containing protein
MRDQAGLGVAAFEALSEGIVVQTMDTTIIQANEAATRILGMSLDQMSGRTSLDPRWRAIHDDGSPFPGEDHPSMACIATGESVRDVVMGVHKPDGDLTWILINVEPILEGEEQTGIVCSFRDFTEEHNLRAQLAESEQRYRLLAENSADIIVRIDHGVITWTSPSLKAVLGWSPEEWLGQPPLTFAHPNDCEELMRAGGRIRDGEAVSTRCRLRRSDGRYRWVEGHGRTYLAADGRAHGVIATLHDVDVEVRAGAYEHRARHDALTGLFNRDETVDRLTAILERPPEAGRVIAIAFCDIDDFKGVNDTHGHLVGDAVLTATAERLSRCVRDTDHVGRLGGDELMVILDRLRDLEAVKRIASQICESMHHPIPTEAGTLDVTISVGVAVVTPGDSVDGLLARADEAMYEAKRSGKDRVVVERG